MNEGARTAFFETGDVVVGFLIFINVSADDGRRQQEKMKLQRR